MFLKSTAAALTVLMLATTAQAQSVSSGDAQLAAIAGVEAGALSTADLVNLINARNENDQTTVDFILSKAGIVGVSRAATFDGVTASGTGWDMVARANGLQPGQYTPAELAQLDNDRISD
jgi:hypothetical protein